MTADDYILVQTILMIVLVSATIFYAYQAKKASDSAKASANASVKMAEEMREQRRPVVVQEVVPAKSVPYKLAAEDITRSISSDYFEIHNEGYGPAIELEILLLDKEKRQLGKQRATFFPKVSESPLEFHPNGLTNHVNSTCYLLCRYRVNLYQFPVKFIGPFNGGLLFQTAPEFPVRRHRWYLPTLQDCPDIQSATPD